MLWWAPAECERFAACPCRTCQAVQASIISSIRLSQARWYADYGPVWSHSPLFLDAVSLQILALWVTCLKYYIKQQLSKLQGFWTAQLEIVTSILCTSGGSFQVLSVHLKLNWVLPRLDSSLILSRVRETRLKDILVEFLLLLISTTYDPQDLCAAQPAWTTQVEIEESTRGVPF